MGSAPGSRHLRLPSRHRRASCSTGTYQRHCETLGYCPFRDCWVDIVVPQHLLRPPTFKLLSFLVHPYPTKSLVTVARSRFALAVRTFPSSATLLFIQRLTPGLKSVKYLSCQNLTYWWRSNRFVGSSARRLVRSSPIICVMLTRLPSRDMD